jgi:hypothetical protein
MTTKRIHFRLDDASVRYLEEYMREHAMPSLNSALNKAIHQLAKEHPLPRPQLAHK